MSPMHLNRYLQEFAGHYYLRDADTLSQMGFTVRGLEGKRLTYVALKHDDGLSSGVRVLTHS